MDRIRHCSSGHDEDCPGTAFENVHCNSGPCPSKYIFFLPIMYRIRS